MRGTGKVIWCCVMVCGQGSEAGEPADRHDGLRQDGGLRLRQEAAPRAEDQYAVRHARVPGAGAGHAGRPHARRRLVCPPSCLSSLHGSCMAARHSSMCCHLSAGVTLRKAACWVQCRLWSARTMHTVFMHSNHATVLGVQAAELLRGCKHFLRMRYMPPTRNVLQWLVMQVGSGRAHLRDDCWLPALP